jgi:hypothetical protein
MTKEAMSPKHSSYSFDGHQFCLRQNRDGTVDSICLKCFATVSHGEGEIEMAAAQLQHLGICVPYNASPKSRREM